MSAAAAAGVRMKHTIKQSPWSALKNLIGKVMDRSDNSSLDINATDKLKGFSSTNKTDQGGRMYILLGSEYQVFIT